ncbi:MAG: hypothetical protein E7329_10030 [Clostridiales bacterium]|nr:hypothetical protein [Clostridiales bacterium]
MKKKGSRGAFFTPGRTVAAGVMALALSYGMMIADAKAPEDNEMQSNPIRAETVSEENIRTGKNCEIVQTMGFSSCGHSVTRRIEAPEALKNQKFEEIQAHYSLWQIESFQEDRVVMQREIMLYCPMHKVLTVNDAGRIVLSENLYGDGMAVIHSYDRWLQEFDEESRAQLLLGIGFDTQEEAEGWLGAH